MNKWSFWQKDWFVGLLVALVFLFGANSDQIQSLERKAYDTGMLAFACPHQDRPKDGRLAISQPVFGDRL